jgi:8-oxo-dGTP pyrophosphatase MutT (NUDIX family)
LIRRRDVPVWVFPGGGIEGGETPSDAVEREVYEETGIAVTVDRLIGTYLPVNSLASETKVFECTPKVAVPCGYSITNEETLEVAFFPITQLPKLFFFLHEEWLQDALERRNSSIVRYMTHITWWALAKQGFRHPLLVIRYLFSRLGMPMRS